MNKQLFFAISLILITSLSFGKTFKIATEYPDGTGVLAELRAAGERIEERTNGSVNFKFYPGGVMGDGIAVQRKVRIGQLDGSFIHSGALASSFRDGQVLNAPLLFRNFEEVDAVRAQFDDEFNQGFIDSGWHTFGLVEGGFAYAMTNEPVESLDQIREQKIWLPANDPLSEKIAKSFDINPIALNIGDVLTALQTGAINAIVAPPVGAITLQWYSKASYLMDAPFMYTYGVIAIAEKSFRGLDDDQMAIVSEELTLASKIIDEAAREDNLKAFDALGQLGIAVLPVENDARRSIEEEAHKATEFLIETGEMSEDLYGRVSALLEDIRSQ